MPTVTADPTPPLAARVRVHTTTAPPPPPAANPLPPPHIAAAPPPHGVAVAPPLPATTTVPPPPTDTYPLPSAVDAAFRVSTDIDTPFPYDVAPPPPLRIQLL